MYEFISGKVIEITPSYVVLENSGIGYFINISLTTYEKINKKETVKLYVHQILREDTNTLFGFDDQNERQIFQQLISVSGIGANTARLMLSSLKPDEIIKSIENSDVAAIKSVKGIGLKTAQRVIVDLKDKMGKMASSDATLQFAEKNPVEEEALSALVMLGFNKKNTEKIIQKIIKETPDISVEEMVKLGIKSMSS